MGSKQIPKVMKKIIATKLSTNFRECTKIVETPVPVPGPNEILVKTKYVGINASDINFTAGRYDPRVKPPFDCGFEGIGEVLVAGNGSKLQPGQPVMFGQPGAFAEYQVFPAKQAFPVPSIKPEFLSLLTSGMTATIALDKVGEIKSGETVLVTAAAGGTGQFAVQWAKRAGCHVIGTCSSADKVDFLKRLGCDRPINYKKENLKEVLKSEYPKGVDVVYESVGGEVFNTCINSLAKKGRLIIIGFISGYESGEGFKATIKPGVPGQLLSKSASLRGFMVFDYVQYFPEYLKQLVSLVQSGQFQSQVDTGHSAPGGHFLGLERIADAVEYLYSGRSQGKILVELSDGITSRL